MNDTRKVQLHVELAGLWLGILLAFAFLLAWRHSEVVCDARHGVLVRGTVWFACVQPSRP